MIRSYFLVVALIAPAMGDDLPVEISRSIDRATRALIERQSPDGSWRSTTYGVFKDGLSLTPSVFKAVAFAPSVEGSDNSRIKAAAYLARLVRPDGTIDDGPFGRIYPVYFDAAATIGLTKVYVPGGRDAISGFVADLRNRQLVGPLGWSPNDQAFGGWGYAVEPTRKRPGLHSTDADLSSTLFAVGALRIAGATVDDPAIRQARTFIERCQNFGTGDPASDDGGFFLSPVDPARNKAGAAGADARGQTRFHSYGSATADGLRALLRVGLAPDHPRVVAALGWLERNFSSTTVPGRFEPAAEPERDATYFDYCWSIGHAFRSLGIRSFVQQGRTVVWADEIARELIRRQRPDGTWSNRFSASKEDDPLVATPFALGALANGLPTPR